MDRSARTLLAVAFFTIAAFLGADLLIRRAAIGEWLLVGILTLLGLVFLWLGVRPERAPASEPAADEPLVLSPALPAGVHVYDVVRVPVPAPAPAPKAPVVTGDDLTVVDGIGPKTAEALYTAGVTTFEQLAEMKPDAITSALHAEGARGSGSVDTWPHQARLAARGDWPGLMRYIAGLKEDTSDDLLVLDGVGPKVDAALKAADVKTFAQVAEMTPEALRAILDAAGVRVVGSSIDTWPHQAKLAADEDWPGSNALHRRVEETGDGCQRRPAHPGWRWPQNRRCVEGGRRGHVRRRGWKDAGRTARDPAECGCTGRGQQH